MGKGKFVLLIVGALCLLVGSLYSLYQSSLSNPEGAIIKSKNYGYSGVSFSDSIWVFTGSDVLMSGSGKMIVEEFPVVLEIQYSSGASLTHRKISISSGNLVNEQEGVYNIFVGSGYVITDVLTDDGQLGLFKEIEEEVSSEEEFETDFEATEKVNSDGGSLINSSLSSDSADSNSNFQSDKDAEDQDSEVELGDGSFSDSGKASVDLEDDASRNISDETTGESGKNNTGTGETIVHNNQSTNSGSNTISGKQDSSDNISNDSESEEQDTVKNNDDSSASGDGGSRWGDDFENTSEPEPEDEEENTLFWGQYPDTDEGNFQLSLDKMDANYCKRIDGSELRIQCEQEIFEALGKCSLLEDEYRMKACNNVNIKNTAIASERIYTCTTIQDDEDLKNECIATINQNFYDAAIKANDSSICSGIYDSSMQATCILEIEGE